MRNFTEKEIMQRVFDWGLDPDSDEDFYTARESLYCDNGGVAVDAYNDGVI